MVSTNLSAAKCVVHCCKAFALFKVLCFIVHLVLHWIPCAWFDVLCFVRYQVLSWRSCAWLDFMKHMQSSLCYLWQMQQLCSNALIAPEVKDESLHCPQGPYKTHTSVLYLHAACHCVLPLQLGWDDLGPGTGHPKLQEICRLESVASGHQPQGGLYCCLLGQVTAVNAKVPANAMLVARRPVIHPGPL